MARQACTVLYNTVTCFKKCFSEFVASQINSETTPPCWKRFAPPKHLETFWVTNFFCFQWPSTRKATRKRQGPFQTFREIQWFRTASHVQSFGKDGANLSLVSARPTLDLWFWLGWITCKFQKLVVSTKKNYSGLRMLLYHHLKFSLTVFVSGSVKFHEAQLPRAPFLRARHASRTGARPPGSSAPSKRTPSRGTLDLDGSLLI